MTIDALLDATRIDEQGWLGQEGRRRPAGRLPEVVPFRRTSLVVAAAAERGAPTERFGLAAFRVVRGPSALRAGVIVPDGLAERDPDASARLHVWATAQRVSTPVGDRPFEILALSQFCDPRTGLFWRVCYSGAGFLVTADLGRLLGLIAGRWAPSRGFFSGGFTFHLPGCFVTDPTTPGRQVAVPHRPEIRCKPLGDAGYIAAFGTPRPRGGGKRVGGHPYRGRFFDVLPAASALDGLDSDELADHLAAWDLPGADLPAAVPLDPAGAEQLTAAAEGVHILADRVARSAESWLDGRLDPTSLYTAGSLVPAMLRQSGATAPLDKVGSVTDDVLDRFAAAQHGGRVEHRYRGIAPGVDVDLVAAYPRLLHGGRWWAHVTAERYEVRDLTDDVRELVGRIRAGADPVAAVLASGIFAGAWPPCVVEVESAGALFPVEHSGAVGRMAVHAVHGRLTVSLPELLATTGAFEIRRAIAVVGIGREHTRAIRLPGTVVPPGDDPWPVLHQLRERAKRTGDTRTARALRVIGNSAYGQLARTDPIRRSGRLGEVPGPWAWPPLAQLAPALCRAFLMLLDRAVEAAGGALLYMDTDGAMLFASPDGGETITLADGREARALSWAEVDELLARFTPALDLFGDGAVFKLRREHDGRPIRALILGPKRYACFVDGEPGQSPELVDDAWSEHALGGVVVNPSGMPGRTPDGDHSAWVRSFVAESLLPRAVAEAAGSAVPLARYLWDTPTDRFPALRRMSVGSPDALAKLAAGMCRPFGGYLQAVSDRDYKAERSLVTLDPGDDLAGWRDLPWCDPDGRPVPVTTTFDDRNRAQLLETLRSAAARWGRGSVPPGRGPISVHPLLVRRVGRRGPVLEAAYGDPDGDFGDLLVVHFPDDAPAFVVELARQVGSGAFADIFHVHERTAKRIRAGVRPSRATAERVVAALADPRVGEALRDRSERVCALGGCDRPALPRGRWCSPAHRAAGSREARGLVGLGRPRASWKREAERERSWREGWNR